MDMGPACYSIYSFLFVCGDRVGSGSCVDFIFSFVMIIQTIAKVEIAEGGSQSGN